VQTLSDVIELMCGHQIEMASEEGCGGRAFLAAIPDPGDEPFKNALLASGFRQGHVFLKMERPLESVDVSGDLPEGLTVRVPNVEDYRDVYEFDRKIMRGQWAVETPTDEHFRWWSEEAFLNPELWLVGWDGDRIVATTAGAVGGTWNPALGGDRAEIRFVRVDPAWRRRGIASNLIQRCLKALYDRGIRQVELSVDGENETSAAALYRSLGFEVTSSLHAYCRDFGE